MVGDERSLAFGHDAQHGRQLALDYAVVIHPPVGEDALLRIGKLDVH